MVLDKSGIPRGRLSACATGDGMFLLAQHFTGHTADELAQAFRDSVDD